jgi:putative ABC transport system ATP-binding protein
MIFIPSLRLSAIPINMTKPILEVAHVSKSVTDATGTLDILRDIDFQLQRGETVAIVGASGSGKSTLLSIMAGLDTPTQGTVRLAGEDLFARDEDARAAMRAQYMGFVFQSFQLLGSLTALENVMLASSNGSPWHGPLWFNQRCCWPTSPLAAWTRPVASGSCN